MIVPVMAISNLVLTRQIYSEETNGAHAHYREPVPLTLCVRVLSRFLCFCCFYCLITFSNVQLLYEILSWKE